MYGEPCRRKNREPQHSAPVEMTEEQVRAARAGKGTHCLPEKESPRDERSEKKAKDKKAKD
jgi:hypothetical protein